MDTKTLTLQAPITRWDEAIPLGNGLTGVLLWGDSRRVKLSLDRGDLWDERMGGVLEHPDWNRRAMEEIVAAKDRERLAYLDKLAEAIPATKLPVGRIEIDFAPEESIEAFVLDMAQATGFASDRAGSRRVECFCAADQSAIYLRLAAPERARLRIVPPDYASQQKLADQGFVRSPAVLGYAAPVLKSCEHGMYYIQSCGETGLHYGIFLARLTDAVWRIEIRRADSAAAMAAISAGFEQGRRTNASWDDALTAHCRWWRAFWERSAVSLPEPEFERYYHLCRYFYGAASRQGAPPMPLQGVWTADDGTLPPWRGDYHHDLNTQMTYISYMVSGDFDCGASFFDHLSSQIEVYRGFARRFYGVEGVAIPGTATLAGQELGGWPQYSMSPTNSAWLAAMFVQHYRYTRDPEFLRRQAWPFVTGVGEFLLAMLKLNEAGQYELPLTSSPEIHNNNLEAFLHRFSNYDLALVRKLFDDLVWLSQELGESDRWSEHLARLPEFAVDAEKGLMLCPGENLAESHRHHSHLMAIYPLRLLNMEQDPEVIRASLLHLDSLGMACWVGFGFSWSGAMSAYCGMGDRALRMLRIFCDGFISRNGFHLNGDYKDYGYCAWKYRPFTLETNLLTQQIIHEMLLQTQGGTVRVFPALPSEWRDVSFRDWCGEGGVRVSAVLTAGCVTEIRIRATEAVTLRIANPGYGAEQLRSSVAGLDLSGPVWEVKLAAGQELLLSR